MVSPADPFESMPAADVANRVKSTEIALEKAVAEVKGSVLASDAFFPFSWGDSVEMACKVGM